MPRAGDLVRQKEGRHLGRVAGVMRGSGVMKVMWDESGWTEFFPISDVEDGSLLLVRTLICGCAMDGSVICEEHAS